MNKYTHFHLLHYFVLILILSLGVVGFFFYQGIPDKQLVIAVVTSVSYFLWGIVHHYLEGDLHPKIVVEYLLIAICALLLLRGAIFR